MNAPRVLLHTNALGEAMDVVKAAHTDLDIVGCASHTDLPVQIESHRPDVVYGVRFDDGSAFPRDALLAAPGLKWLAVGGSGTDHLGHWDTDRLDVTNTAGIAADMMAQYTLGTLLSFTLGLPRFRELQRAREWDRGAMVESIEDKRVLIVGLGHTGRAVAARCKALGLAVTGVRARPCATEHVDAVHPTEALLGLIPEADVIVVCVPRLPQTLGLIGPAAFGAMKRSAILIDVSRGGVTDEAALLEALTERRIRGAALDVFATEPLPRDHPLWACDNAIVTPHCSSVSADWSRKSVQHFCDNLARFRSGEPLTNVVDPVRGY